MLLGAEAGSLAVVSAIIIVQTTNWQTVRKGIERVLPRGLEDTIGRRGTHAEQLLAK